MESSKIFQLYLLVTMVFTSLELDIVRVHDFLIIHFAGESPLELETFQTVLKGNAEKLQKGVIISFPFFNGSNKWTLKAS